jgi:hypothetical protein
MEDTMKKLALFVLLLTLFCRAAQNTDEYPVNVHVSSSRWVMEPGPLGPESVQRLSVTIDGKKYELEALVALTANLHAGVTLLALGDYKAKLVQDVHKTTYESSQAYEFQLSDKKTRKFIVVSQSE